MSYNKPRNKITTPAGVFVYPKLNRPDTKFQPDGVYDVKVRYTEEEAQPLINQLTAMADAAYVDSCKEEGKAKLKRAALPIVKEEDKEGNETGNYLLHAKLKAMFKTKDGTEVKARPTIYDSQGNVITNEVWGGSIGKLSVEVIPYYVALVGAGITLRLKAVQIIKLVEGGQGASAESHGFGKEDGFVAEPKAPEFAKEEGTVTDVASAQAGEF